MTKPRDEHDELEEPGAAPFEPMPSEEDPWQVWTPPRGPLTKIVAWVVLFVVLAGTLVMILRIVGF